MANTNHSTTSTPGLSTGTTNQEALSTSNVTATSENRPSHDTIFKAAMKEAQTEDQCALLLRILDEQRYVRGQLREVLKGKSALAAQFCDDLMKLQHDYLIKWREEPDAAVSMNEMRLKLENDLSIKLRESDAVVSMIQKQLDVLDDTVVEATELFRIFNAK